MNRLHAGELRRRRRRPTGPPAGGPEGADQPQVGRHRVRHRLCHLRDRPDPRRSTPRRSAATRAGGQTERIDSLPNSDAARRRPRHRRDDLRFIAWQQKPGRRRARPRSACATPPTARTSVPSRWSRTRRWVPPTPTRGSSPAGDVAGDAAVAWVQGSGASTSIVAAQLFQAPGGVRAPPTASATSPRRHPVLVWSASSELWGAPTYVVRVDGVAIGQTTATSLVPRRAAVQRPPHLAGQRHQPGGLTHQRRRRPRCSSTPCRRAPRGSSAAARSSTPASSCASTTPTRRRRDCPRRPPRGWPRCTSTGATRSPPGADPPHQRHPRLHAASAPTRSRSPPPTGPATRP